MTNNNWEAIEERFGVKHGDRNNGIGSNKSIIATGTEIKDIISFFKKEFEATETPGEEEDDYERYSHEHCWNNERKNLGGVPPCGIKIENHKQCCLCDVKSPQPESSWEERFKNRYEKSEIYNPVYADWFPDDVIKFISIEISEAEKRGFNLALEEAEKKIEYISNLIKWKLYDLQVDGDEVEEIIKSIEALKK